VAALLLPLAAAACVCVFSVFDHDSGDHFGSRKRNPITGYQYRRQAGAEWEFARIALCQCSQTEWPH
jgi:hypothetical protein